MIPATIANLDFNAKLQLVWELWDSIAEDKNKIPLSASNKKELEHTLSEYRRTGEKGDMWDVVKARIRASR